MFKVIILPLAKQDIKEAADWYNSRQEGLGKRLTAEVTKKINQLKRNPHIAANRYDEVRTAVLNIFPFMVHYSIDDVEKVILVSAVLHTSRNPDVWKTDRDTLDVVD